jgi:hypothetical protein
MTCALQLPTALYVNDTACVHVYALVVLCLDSYCFEVLQ